jgi:hypothetical protein
MQFQNYGSQIWLELNVLDSIIHDNTVCTHVHVLWALSENRTKTGSFNFLGPYVSQQYFLMYNENVSFFGLKNR